MYKVCLRGPFLLPEKSMLFRGGERLTSSLLSDCTNGLVGGW